MVWWLKTMPVTMTALVDGEWSQSNSWQAGSLDFEWQKTSLFSLGEMIPEATYSAQVRLDNKGSLSGSYQLAVDQINSEGGFCDNLWLQAYRESDLVYQGQLTNFISDSYELGSNQGDNWEFRLSMINSNESYQLKKCSFNIKSTSWNGFSDVELIASEVIAGDWIKPEVSLSITGSWTKVLEEQVINGGFEQGDLSGWKKEGVVEVVNSSDVLNPNETVLPIEGNYMVRIGNKGEFTSGNFVWENRLLQSFKSGAKSLSLSYNFFTRDTGPMDEPGFLVRLNGEEVYDLRAEEVNPNWWPDGSAYSTGWQEISFDLSRYQTENINLGLYAGNTGDQENQSWVYVDKITTYWVAAPMHATYALNASDNGSGVDKCYYRLDGGSWQEVGEGVGFGITSSGNHELEFYCTDKAGNASEGQRATIVVDTIAPAEITDLMVDGVSENSVALSWTAVGDDGWVGRAARYDLRYQANCSDPTQFDFESANQYKEITAPNKVWESERVEVIGLEPNTDYCLGIKVSDEAPNTSGISNVVVATTDLGLAPASPGDVVINELMWMGSDVSPYDEWLELRNLTARAIDLSGWQLVNFYGQVIYTFPVGTVIGPREYLVVSEYDAAHSSLKNEPDLVVGSGSDNDPTFALSNDTLLLELDDNLGNLIDVVGDGGIPWFGVRETTEGQYYSMERTSVPGDGSEPLNWYTCIDEPSGSEFFDSSADVRGTPGAENRSENEPPLAEQMEPKAELKAKLGEGQLTLRLEGVEAGTAYTYEVVYQTAQTTEGIRGEGKVEGEGQSVIGPLILGTCSSGGSCVYHQNVHEIKAKVWWQNKEGEEKIVEAEL